MAPVAVWGIVSANAEASETFADRGSKNCKSCVVHRHRRGRGGRFGFETVGGQGGAAWFGLSLADYRLQHCDDKYIRLRRYGWRPLHHRWRHHTKWRRECRRLYLPDDLDHRHALVSGWHRNQRRCGARIANGLGVAGGIGPAQAGRTTINRPRKYPSPLWSSSLSSTAVAFDGITLVADGATIVKRFVAESTSGSQRPVTLPMTTGPTARPR